MYLIINYYKKENITGREKLNVLNVATFVLFIRGEKKTEFREPRAGIIF